jgi:hypothetical protein
MRYEVDRVSGHDILRHMQCEDSMIKVIENGDIFGVKADAFCHGVNTKGIIGGLAG